MSVYYFKNESMFAEQMKNKFGHHHNEILMQSNEAGITETSK